MNKQHYRFRSYEPPTALHHGGVFYCEKTMEENMAAINQTTQDMGLAMRRARILAYVPRAEVARLLRTDVQTLGRYEAGIIQMPIGMMQSIFAQAFIIMRARAIQKKYMEYAHRLRETNMLDLADDMDDVGVE